MRIKIIKYIPVFFFMALTACDHEHDHVFQGYVEGNNVYLVSPYSGTLIHMPFGRGAEVHQGDLVFQLDPNPEAMEIKQAEILLREGHFTLKDQKSPKREPEIRAATAQVNQAAARLKLAHLREERYEYLYKKRAGNLDSADEARSQVIELDALKIQREAELELATLGGRKNKIEELKTRVEFLLEKMKIAKWKLDQKKGYATEDGSVFDTYYREGEWVDAGTPVVALLLAKHIYIEFFVPVSMLSKLKLNETVYFTCDGCAIKNEAKLDYIARQAEYVPPLVYSRDNYDKLVFRIRAKPMQPSLFKPGQPVTITGFEHGE